MRLRESSGVCERDHSSSMYTTLYFPNTEFLTRICYSVSHVIKINSTFPAQQQYTHTYAQQLILASVNWSFIHSLHYSYIFSNFESIPHSWPFGRKIVSSNVVLVFRNNCLTYLDRGVKLVLCLAISPSIVG